MKKTKFLFASALCALMSMSFVGCDTHDDPEPDGPTAPTETLGVYILNSGNSGSNNSTLDYYNPATKILTTKVFSSINGRKLGDTANDMLTYGSKMYIAVNGSATIEVTDLDGKSLKTIHSKDEAGIPQQPRMLEAYNGKVYATFFDGYLACIDTTNLAIEKQVKAGIAPEGVRELNGKLYVASSGGWSTRDSSLLVIDPVTFTVTKDTITVVQNPQTMYKDSQGDMYIIPWGNYDDIKNTLQRMDGNTGKVTTVCNATMCTITKDVLYAIYAQYGEPEIKYIKYDTKTEKVLSENFITDGTVLNNTPYKISSDPVSGNVYISTSDYTNTGDMYIFSPEGKLLNKLGVSGLNPMGAYFVVK